jgi:hypothetical protein
VRGGWEEGAGVVAALAALCRPEVATIWHYGRVQTPCHTTFRTLALCHIAVGSRAHFHSSPASRPLVLGPTAVPHGVWLVLMPCGMAFGPWRHVIRRQVYRFSKFVRGHLVLENQRKINIKEFGMLKPFTGHHHTYPFNSVNERTAAAAIVYSFDDDQSLPTETCCLCLCILVCMWCVHSRKLCVCPVQFAVRFFWTMQYILVSY